MEVNLDTAEKDAQGRFDALKAEGALIEGNMQKEQARLDEIKSELVRIQGEYRVIQNLRKQTDVGLPTNEA